VTNTDDVFSDAAIAQLVRDCRLERLVRASHLDVARLGAGIRIAALGYALDRQHQDPNPNEIRREIAAHYAAALRQQHERVVTLAETLSPAACAYLATRQERPGLRAAGLRLPTLEALRDPARRDEACERVARICRIGGRIVAGRMRPPGVRERRAAQIEGRPSKGKQSRTFQAKLHAPAPLYSLPKRPAVQMLVLRLALAWQQATGEPPARTARRGKFGPFTRLVAACLPLMGVRHVSITRLINETRWPERWPECGQE
jgi:hypothetical protein